MYTVLNLVNNVYITVHVNIRAIVRCLHQISGMHREKNETISASRNIQASGQQDKSSCGCADDYCGRNRYTVDNGNYRSNIMSRKIVHVYVDGLDMGTIPEVAKDNGKSLAWVYSMLNQEYVNGHRWSRNPGSVQKSKAEVKTHHHGEPLIRHPVTCGIGTNWGNYL